MTDAKYGLLTIGNALVDVLAHASEEFIQEQYQKHGMERASMNLINETRAKELYGQMGPAIESSGGSAGNTSACYASLGGNGAYIGKVADDQLGEVFKHDMRAIGVHYDTTPLAVGPATGRCMVLVTPDGERTMNTFLGAAVELDPNDIDEELVAACAVTYLEGYLFDPPQAKEAFVKASELAHKAGRKVALTLSDPFCVDRHRDDFLDLVDRHIDILFANEDEIKSLFSVSDWNDIPALVDKKCEMICLTRSEKGSVIMNGQDIYEVPAKATNVVDTTGAGDAYAAGFLYGYTQGLPLHEAGEIGSIAASEVISHMGPRPQADLKTLLPKKAA